MNKPAVSIDIDQLRDNADEAGQLLKALGNPDRLLLLCQLVAGEMNVGELEDRLKIVQPT
ncbi:MAG TPA: transcriptional regulator, partial [Pseudomonas sp.]|nr:transcriptional regulator [Pseudomonas sp.]